jgi:AcrR family transcriptional regulator
LTATERRRKILAAAIRSFAKDGYDRTLMEAIAARAGITKPVLYDHFPSKRLLFRAVLESIRERLMTTGHSIARSPSDAEQKFRAGVDAFFAFVEESPDAARVLLAVPYGDPLAVKISREVQTRASAGIAELLAPYLPKSESWRLHAAAEFLKAGLHALADWWLKNPGPSRPQLVDLVMSISWVGFRSSRASATSRPRT